MAPENNIKAVEAAVNSATFDEGLKAERKLFGELMSGPQSANQRYYFFAERQAQKIPDVPDDTPTRPIKKVGIIGAGTMGGGIAMNFANVGIPVVIVEQQQAPLDRGLATIRKQLRALAHREAGRDRKAREPDHRLALHGRRLQGRRPRHRGGVRAHGCEEGDLHQAGRDLQTGCILATNTSGLNIDEIASVTKRPQDVIGLHFFSPANVMKLLEIVRADHTAKDVIATSMKLAKQIGKIAVLVGVTPGFVGNRILGQRQREAQKLVMEGAMPWDIDRVLYDFGFPMGPFAMSDLAGLDIGWIKEKSHGETIRDVLCEMDRRGPEDRRRLLRLRREPQRQAQPVTEKIITTSSSRRAPTRARSPTRRSWSGPSIR
jgi:3-hydroxyacyl-CoA dehydrogenase